MHTFKKKLWDMLHSRNGTSRMSARNECLKKGTHSYMNGMLWDGSVQCRFQNMNTKEEIASGTLYFFRDGANKAVTEFHHSDGRVETL